MSTLTNAQFALKLAFERYGTLRQETVFKQARKMLDWLDVHDPQPGDNPGERTPNEPA